jgi:large subunit ribosomal protein L10
MNKQEKHDQVEQLAAQFEKFQYFYITDTSNLSAQSTNKLRRLLHKEGISMQVAKNTLIRKALERNERNFDDLQTALKGTTAILFSDDMKAPAKVIKEFRKGNDKPLLKAAFIDSAVYLGDNQLDMLTKLKTKNELIGEIIGLLQSPAKNVVSALQSSGGKLAGIIKTLSEKENN